jgi:hypothetical protein
VIVYGQQQLTGLTFTLLVSRLETGERAFTSAGPRILNSLLDDIINCQSLPVFHRKLKAHLFQVFLS